MMQVAVFFVLATLIVAGVLVHYSYWKRSR